MGFWDWLRGGSTYQATPADTTYNVVDRVTSDILNQSVDQLWRRQPYLRTVVSFIARNIAQIGMHVLEREADGGRRRVRDGAAAKLLQQPSPESTWYELVYDLVSTLALYDDAVLWLRSNSETERFELRLIRPNWIVGWEAPTAFSRGACTVAIPGTKKIQKLPADSLITFHGWDPTDARAGSSPVEALRTIIAEQWEANQFRLQMWKKGGRVGSYLTRPAGTDWKPETRKRFIEEFRAQYTGPQGGGVPLLEDGMEMKRVGFAAKEEEFVDSAKLALTTVASVYHINPTMLGLLDNANYSNVREFRRMLYGDSLGPIIRQIEDRLNAFLMPKLGAPEGQYIEFNLHEKLRGSFEEQAAVYQAGVGGPWMTVNEARSRENMPTIEGGDDLIRPLNVGTATDSDTDEPDEPAEPAEPEEEAGGKSTAGLILPGGET